MAFNCPVSTRKADQLIDQLALTRGQAVLDAGCGNGEFLLRLLARAGATGTGVDSNAASIAEAEDRARSTLPNGSCRFLATPMAEADVAPGSFDAAVCLGSTHAFGRGQAAWPNALAGLARLVRPGGRLLLGEGYWRRPPDPAYRALLGEPVGIYHDHAGNIAVAEQLGLVPLYAMVSSDDEWDDFEWGHRQRFELAARANPEDPEVRQRLQTSREWRDGYLRWGRDTMGFGLYVFLRP